MAKINQKSTTTAARPRRSGTLLVGLAAVGAAWVLTACDPGLVGPVMMAVIPAAAAADKPAAQVQVRASEVSRGQASQPLYGEISSIEPIKPASAEAASAPVGYRIHILLENGTTTSFERSQLNGLDVGARVKVDGGQLTQV